MMRKPAQLNYRMPAEWEKHEATWLAWPHNKQDWPGKFTPIPWVYIEIIRNIVPGERVRLIVKDAKAKAEAKEFLKRGEVDVSKVDIYIVPSNRGWLRDAGPIFIVNKEGKAITDWKFNAWAKYSNNKLDDAIPTEVNKLFKLPHFAPEYNGKRVVLEGGSIDVNGKGTLITTEECLLSKIQERNKGLKREDYEKIFADYLGISHVIWLDKGIVGDDTHGHIDDITRFVNATTVVTAVEKNKKDENYAILAENLKRLKKATDQNGKPLNIVELPMPKPVVFEGQRLPASYANFLITNSAVLVPTFNDSADRIALNILAELFPKRDVVGINSTDLVWGLGTIHCMSQQEPA